ncbi:retrotransposon protein, putative, unclassified [Tanacetum coccineum]|uniref:Retrotransposon protein, putative, unclassified n=1 Tax=Tanacetum coccineum TaxID=301880 RepID=A0ABQ5HJS2_9ASTR
MSKIIIDESSCSVMGYYLALVPWYPDKTLEEIDFNRGMFWVQAHGLPFGKMKKGYAIELASKIGTLVEVDCVGEGLQLNRFLRFRVEADLSVPLCRGIELPRVGLRLLFISFKYERLSNFCYACGRLGHDDETCTFPRDPRFTRKLIDNMCANSAKRISLSQKSPTNVDSCPLQAPKIGDTTLQVVVEDTNRSVSAKTTTPLSMVSDKLVWHYEAKGRYTMKSGYRQVLLQHENHSNMIASSSLAPNKSFWNELWNLKTLPRVKFFWWKACSNALATHENLLQRGCNCSPICTICCTSVETVEHMLFECPWTKHGSIISCVQALLETIHSKSERMKLHTSLANITWQIWKSRNGKVFNACQLCPPHNCVKLNCDASYKPYRAALGVIARDSTGSILLCSGEIWCVSDPLMAKILAIRSACHLAISQGWQNATIELDSKLAV